jgi:two-component system chemotaxis response regulator CheB
VVVIGASAGGLEGLMRIVRDLEPGLPAAFFVAMHVSPTAKSRLAEILGRAGQYPTRAIAESEPIVPGCIYVAQPDRHLIVEDGQAVVTTGPRENHHRPSIDALFRSAAIAYGPNTVGVILSGTLDDGTAGLRWIKRYGGVALVQDPAEALFRGMPASAIANVNVDHVLRADELAAGIAQAVKHREEAAVTENGAVDDQGAPADEGARHPASDFVCPDCGGTLFAVGEDEVMRFRCRVGHAYSPEGLHAVQNRNLEESLWTAVRSLQEHADLSRRLAEWAHRASLPIAEANFANRAEDALRKAAVVRRAIDEVSNVPQEPQNRPA